MKKSLRCSVVCLIFILSTAAGAAAADTYVVAVGSGDYVSTDDPALVEMADNEAAYLGARKVAQLFAQGGARRVIQLLGRDGEHVGPADVDKAINDMLAAVQLDGPADPLLVVYLSGHGLSEGFGYNLFLMPGDLLLPGDSMHQAVDETGRKIRKFDGDVVQLGEATIHAGKVSDRLANTGLPFLLIFDTCYETQSRDYTPLTLSDEPVAQLIGNVADIIRFTNLPRGPHPVLFSARPGTLAEPARDPDDTTGKQLIAPVARRMLLAARREFAAGREAVRLDRLIQALTDPAFDLATAPAATWFASDPGLQVVLRADSPPASVEKRRGTAYSPRSCCGMGTPEAAGETNSPEARVSGYLSFAARGSDYVMGGLAFERSFESAEASVWELEPGKVWIEVEWPDDISASIGLATPDAGFQVGRYDGAQRYSFADPGRPGLEISLNGRGCNEISGNFDVRAIDHGADGSLRTLEVSLEQTCDGGAGALVGQVRLTFE